MNQIYKVIWSRVKRCYVVVSEIAGRCGKNGGVASEKKSMPVRAFLCALAVTGCLLPGMAEAKTEYGPGASATGTASVAVGDDAKAAAVNSSAYGLKSKALSSHSVAIGNEASVGKGDPDPESSQNGIAIGHGANVTVNPATATPGITDKSGGIAIGHNATTKDINTVALGTGTVGQGAQAVAIGRNAHTDGNNTVAIGNNTWVRSTNGFALGNEARAGIDEAGNIIGKDNDQAFGSNARAWGGSSMAFGNNAKAANGGAIAMGNGSQSRGDWGVAIGNGAKALADGARALGANSTAKGVNSTAIGWDSKSEADRGIAIGETASVEDGTEHGIAIGTGAKASGKGSTGTPSLPASTVAIGQGSQALENGDIVIGRKAKSIASTEHGNPGSGAVVAGAEAAAYGARGDVVIGAAAETNVKIKQSGGTVDPKYAQGVAIGSTAKTYGTQSLALGADTRAIGNSSVAIGGDDIDMARTELETAVPQLAAGNGIKKSFNKEIETKFPGGLGSASINVKGKYANTAAIGDATTAIGTLSEAYGTGSTAIGINSLTKGVASTGIGIMARSWGTNSLALGTQVGAYGDRSSSIGDTNQVGLDMKDGSKSGKESAAVGSKNTIYGNQAYAVGAGNTIGSATVNTATEANGSAAGADQDKITTVTAGTVKGNMAGAFGYKNTINADNAYAVGSNSTVSADGAMVLGNNASVTAKNGMALGSNTKVANENAVALGAGSETAAAVATPSATINGTAHNFAGVNPASTVSVGKAGSERTITNVAAGRISDVSTDAINGSQLYAVTTEMDKGVAYAGDVKAAAAAANKFTRKLGEQTNIVGGVADASKLTDGNIGVVSNGTDTLNIKLAKDVKVDSVTAGNTVINNNGLTVGGKTYVTNNGLNANSQTITNVASGGNTTTNAANIGDVQTAVNNAVTNVTNTLTAKGLDFEGNDGAANKVHRDLGTKLTVKGGLADVTTGVSGKNLGVKKNAAGDGLDLVMSEKPEFKEVTAGTGTNKVVINDNGVHVGGKTYINNSGLNANNQRITNVATGTAGTDAVNVDQLNAAIGGTAKATTVKAKDANVTVTKGTSAETGGREYTIGLGNVVTVGQTHPVTVNGDAGTVNGLTNTTWDIDNPTVVHGQAATEDQLKTVSDGVKTNKTDITNINTTIGKGLNFKGDDATVINKKLGEQLDIKGGADASKLSDGNIGVVSGNGALNVKLAKDVKVDSVTTGGTVINNNGLTVGGKTYVTNNGLNANGQKITNVEKGTAGTDAVNVDQLNAAIAGTAKATTVKAKDANVTVTEGLSTETGGKEYTVGLGDKVTLGTADKKIVVDGTSGKITAGSKVTIDGTTGDIQAGTVKVTGAGTVNELTNRTWDIDNPTIVHGQAATEDQLKTVSDGVKTNKTNITNINNTIGKGLNFGGDSGAVINKKLGEKLEIKGGASADLTDGNIGVVSDGTKLNVKLKKDVNLGPDGSLTVNGKTYVNKDGLNANGQKITNVANGTVNSDAVNFGQLKDAVAAGKTILKDGKNTTVEGEGTVANPYKVNVNDDLVLGKKGADGKNGSIGVNGKDGSAVVINGKDGSIGLNGKDGANGLTIKGGDGKPGVDGTNITRLIIEEKNGKKHDVATLDDGLKFAGNTGIVAKKLNETMTIKGTGVKADTEYDASNIKTMVNSNGEMIVGLDKNLKADSVGINGKDGRDGATIKGGDGKPGVDGTNITRLIIEEKNGKQHDIATLDDGMKYGGDTGAVIKKKLNGQVNVVGGISDEGKLTTDDNIGVVSDGRNNLKVRLAKDLKGLNSVTTGNTVMNNDGLTIKNGPKIVAAGIDAGGKKITNVAAGEADTDAVNFSQLKNQGSEIVNKGFGIKAEDGNEVKKKLGETVDVVGDGKNISTRVEGGRVKVALKDDISLNSVTTGRTKMDTNGLTIQDGSGNTAVTVNKDGLKIKDGPSVTKSGIDAGGKKITNVAAGEADTDAVNVSQLKKAAAGATTKVADGKNTTVTFETNRDGSKTYHVNLNDDITLGTDSSKQISIKGSEGTVKAGQVTVNGTAGTVNGLTNKTWDPNNITSGQAATEDQLKVVSGQAGRHSSVTAGSNISVTTGTNANGGTEYKVAVVDTPTFKTVTTGNTVMSNNGLTIKNGPSITQTGVDAGGKRITNVAAGKADTDAVNVGQLKQIGGAINKVDNRINRVGAGAAALAALHPLDFDPDDKWDFTLGYGNYKDAHSLALGAFYRPNEDTMISVGGSIGGGENMVNAGLSMKLGQGNHVSTSKVAMAKEIKDLRAELENVKGALLKVADGRPLDSMDMDKMQLFPDVPENHWAYDYVATLAGNGVIVGYPDGQFGGDRMMTRYEMAALIYRAMQNGAAADDRMARALKEFEPELERIRVDTISKHKDGTPDIQRVRVIKGRG